MNRLLLVAATALLLTGCGDRSPMRIFVPDPVVVAPPTPDARLLSTEVRPVVPDVTHDNQQAAAVIVDVGDWGLANEAKVIGWQYYYNCIMIPFVTQKPKAASCDPVPPTLPVTKPTPVGLPVARR